MNKNGVRGFIRAGFLAIALTPGKSSALPSGLAALSNYSGGVLVGCSEKFIVDTPRPLSRTRLWFSFVFQPDGQFLGTVT